MLKGRDSELRSLQKLIEDLRSGKGATLLIEGEPGIGKTALIEEALQGAPDCQILTTRGVESEYELPFAALAELLGPVLGWLDEVPEVQAKAFRAAITVEAIGDAADPFPTYMATVGLLASAAEKQPVVLFVDDVQWLDDASLRALLFAFRRLSREPVLFLFASREAVKGLLDDSSVQRLSLSGLPEAPAIELLQEQAGQPVSMHVARHLVDATDGNPLALIELSRSMSHEQLSGARNIDEPLAPGPGIQRAFSRKLDRLPDESGRALLIAAASDEAPVQLVLDALAFVGIQPDALERAEAEDVVRLDQGRVQFRHPLWRSVIYHRAAPADRRRAHLAIAQALRDVDQERRAWHLGHATIGYDEEAGRALVAAGMAAISKGGYGAAAKAFARAAQLTADQDERSRRLAFAAQAAFRTGLPEEAMASAMECLGASDDPLVRADAVQIVALLETWTDPKGALSRLIQEAENAAATRPDKAASLLVIASAHAVITGDIPQGAHYAEQATEYAPPNTPASVQALVQRAQTAAMLARYPEARESAAQATELNARLGSSPASDRYGCALAAVLTVLGWYAHASQILRSILERSRNQSSLEPIPLALALQGDIEVRTGSWGTAIADLSESVELAEELGQVTQKAHALLVLAQLKACMGLDADCRAHVAQATPFILGANALLAYQAVALGKLEFSLDNPESAATHFEYAATLNDEHGLRDRTLLTFGADWVESLLRSGRRPEALDALRWFEVGAGDDAPDWAKAARLRCYGLLTSGAESTHYFEQALESHKSGHAPFEEARTRLCFGERLRNERRRADARHEFNAALGAFERLNAKPWIERARLQLTRVGGSRSEYRHALDDLTPTEIQVARTVASGASNKEAASALFVSPKTIDFHLSNIYRKLSISSRAQLASLLANSDIENLA